MELFKIFGTIALNGQKDVEKNLDTVNDKASKLSETFLNGIKTATKWSAVAAGACASVAAVITKSAVSAYADYEQLIGGVETLFKDSADKVEEYANQAYKTAGLSANEYMETVTSFSASLLQSLGGDTEKAAEYANMAITDMSDNANKMGTDMASIQNAYQGFAKQNYTMLDNLKLGYGGTKEEMERLLADAEKLSGIEYDISSYADIVDAIHVVQNEMGITGTTAKEASTTIQGSLSSVKASWKNLLVGIADDSQDFDVLVDNFVESVGTAGENILPRVEIAIKGVGKLVQKLVPVIAKSIPGLIRDVMPDMIQSGIDLLTALIDGLTDSLPLLVDSAIEIILMLADAIVDNLPKIIDAGMKILIQLLEGFTKAAPKLIAYIPILISNIVSTITANLPQLIQAGIELLLALVEGILDAIPDMIEQLPEIINSIIDTLLGMLPEIIQCGIDLLTALVDALPEIIDAIVEVLPEIITGITTALLDNIDEIILAGIELFCALVSDIPAIIAGLAEAAPEIIAGIVEALLGGLSDMWEAGKELMASLWDGLKEVWKGVSSWLGEVAQTLHDKLNPSTYTADEEKLEKFANYSKNNKASKTTSSSVQHYIDLYKPKKMAKGGVVKSATNIIAGEDGVETIIPLERNKEWISRVAEDMIKATNNQGTNVSNKTLEEILELLKVMVANLPDVLVESLLKGVKFDVDKREFGRLVRQVNT